MWRDPAKTKSTPLGFGRRRPRWTGEPAARCDLEAAQGFTLGGDSGDKRANKSDDLQSGFWSALFWAAQTRMDKINGEEGSPHMCKQFSAAEQPGAKWTVCSACEAWTNAFYIKSEPGRPR